MGGRIDVRFEIGKNKREAELVTVEMVKIRNISMGGICVETSQYLNPKSSFKVEIVSRDNEKVTFTCEVSWANLLLKVEERDGTITIYEVGLRFVGLTDNEKLFLEKYINEVMK